MSLREDLRKTIRLDNYKSRQDLNDRGSEEIPEAVLRGMVDRLTNRAFLRNMFFSNLRSRHGRAKVDSGRGLALPVGKGIRESFTVQLDNTSGAAGKSHKRKIQLHSSSEGSVSDGVSPASSFVNLSVPTKCSTTSSKMDLIAKPPRKVKRKDADEDLRGVVRKKLGTAVHLRPSTDRRLSRTPVSRTSSRSNHRSETVRCRSPSDKSESGESRSSSSSSSRSSGSEQKASIQRRRVVAVAGNSPMVPISTSTNHIRKKPRLAAKFTSPSPTQSPIPFEAAQLTGSVGSSIHQRLARENHRKNSSSTTGTGGTPDISEDDILERRRRRFLEAANNSTHGDSSSTKASLDRERSGLSGRKLSGEATKNKKYATAEYNESVVPLPKEATRIVKKEKDIGSSSSTTSSSSHRMLVVDSLDRTEVDIKRKQKELKKQRLLAEKQVKAVAEQTRQITERAAVPVVASVEDRKKTINLKAKYALTAQQPVLPPPINLKAKYSLTAHHPMPSPQLPAKPMMTIKLNADRKNVIKTVEILSPPLPVSEPTMQLPAAEGIPEKRKKSRKSVAATLLENIPAASKSAPESNTESFNSSTDMDIEDPEDAGGGCLHIPLPPGVATPDNKDAVKTPDFAMQPQTPTSFGPVKLRRTWVVDPNAAVLPGGDVDLRRLPATEPRPSKPPTTEGYRASSNSSQQPPLPPPLPPQPHSSSSTPQVASGNYVAVSNNMSSSGHPQSLPPFSSPPPFIPGMPPPPVHMFPQGPLHQMSPQFPHGPPPTPTGYHPTSTPYQQFPPPPPVNSYPSEQQFQHPPDKTYQSQEQQGSGRRQNSTGLLPSPTKLGSDRSLNNEAKKEEQYDERSDDYNNRHSAAAVYAVDARPGGQTHGSSRHRGDADGSDRTLSGRIKSESDNDMMANDKKDFDLRNILIAKQSSSGNRRGASGTKLAMDAYDNKEYKKESYDDRYEDDYENSEHRDSRRSAYSRNGHGGSRSERDRSPRSSSAYHDREREYSSGSSSSHRRSGYDDRRDYDTKREQNDVFEDGEGDFSRGRPRHRSSRRDDEQDSRRGSASYRPSRDHPLDYLGADQYINKSQYNDRRSASGSDFRENNQSGDFSTPTAPPNYAYPPALGTPRQQPPGYHANNHNNSAGGHHTPITGPPVSVPVRKPVTAPAPKSYTFFFTKRYPFSNHYPCTNLMIDGQSFACTEQYYMFMKAVSFDDTDRANDILATNDPKRMKGIGSSIANFNQSKWDKISHEIMLLANMEKYLQNPDLRKELFMTAGTTLVEANPTDHRWGIALSMEDPRRFDESQWRGENLMGVILNDIRDTLMAEPKYAKEIKDAYREREERYSRRLTI